MRKPLGPIAKKLLFIPPMLAGLLFLGWMILGRTEPERAPEQEVARVLRVIRAPEPEITPRALGYGTAEAGNVWQAVAEVKGRVIEVHPDLEPGAIVNKDAVVLKIDPNEYELAIARSRMESFTTMPDSDTNPSMLGMLRSMPARTSRRASAWAGITLLRKPPWMIVGEGRLDHRGEAGRM